MRLGPFEIRFRYLPHKQTGTLTVSQFNALMLKDLHQKYIYGTSESDARKVADEHSWEARDDDESDDETDDERR